MASDDACLQLLMQAARVRRSGDVDSGSQLDGVFKRMLEPPEFRRLVYPGLPEAARASAPASLQEVRWAAVPEGWSCALLRYI